MRRGLPKPLPPARIAARALVFTLTLCALGCQAPGPFRLTGASAGQPAPFSAGAASAEFTPEAGYPLGGYGGGLRRAELPFYAGMGWPGQVALACHQSWHEDDPEGRADMLTPAEGADEPLRARALVLRPEGQPPLAFVRIDAIGVTAELHDLVLERVSDLGFRRETLLLSATHTHSGPGAFFRAPVARLIAMDNYRPELEEQIAAAVARALREAYAAARPAALAALRARDRDARGAPVLAKNRRFRRFRDEIAYDAIDDEVGLLYLVERESRAPLALLLNYAVHPTVFGSKHLRFNADLAGALERAFEARLGAPTLFFNGAEGDIGPQSGNAALRSERCTERAEAFARLIAPALEGELAWAETLRIQAATGEKELGAPQGVVALGRERFLDAYRGWASWPMELFTLPVNLVLWTAGLTNVRVVLTWNLGLGVVAHLGNLTPRTITRVGGVRIQAGPHDLAFVTFPGEATHDVGLEARAQAEGRGATQSFVLGLTLDHIAYIASPREYRRGGYEAHSTLFGEHTATQLLEAQRGVLDALGWSAPQ